MSAPNLTQLKYGNRAIFGSGVVLSWVDLNDGTKWMTQSYDVVDARILQHARQLFSGSGVRLGGDNGPKAIKVHSKYDEAGGGGSLSAAKAQITQSGEQWLSIDGVTQTIVETLLFVPKLLRGGTNKLYDVTIDFIARNPWAEDMAATTVAAFAVGGSVGAGTATTFNITYAGHGGPTTYGRPVWVLHIPATNTAPISRLDLANTTSGETLTVIFSTPLAASTLWDITIDTVAWHVTNGAGLEYDIGGSYPALYGPSGTVNAHALTLTTASGTSAGVTLAASYLARWELG
jgi:hypothetical protein